MRFTSILLFSFLCIHGQSQDLSGNLEVLFNQYELMGMSVWTACGEEESQFHFGTRDFTRDLPMNEQSLYRVASISKTVTALGLMKLYDEGEFGLDDDISDYMGYTIENPQYPDSPITFRMLLSHTSSLQDGSGYNDFLTATYAGVPVPSIAELLVAGGDYYSSNMWRIEEPGTYFAYSNINFGLIGSLIEAISGQRFDQYMKSEILDPLDISGSYNASDLEDIDDVVVLYRNQGGWTPQVDNYQGAAPSPPSLDGTALDMVSDSDCFDIQSTPGCENGACQAAICAEDEWCCTNEWDNLCVAAALDICDGSPSDCIAANGTPGCDNNDCETSVCIALPGCCDTAWDEECASMALEICGPGQYIPGTNGAYFAPQGGLRASAADLGKIMRFLQTQGATASGLISASTLETMVSTEWDYNGSNGDNYFGLFNRWGLGVHHANTASGDQICLDQGWGSFIGHPGEAYGLVSDAYYSENGEVSFVFMTNGIWGGYQSGQVSTYYQIEEAVFGALCDHFAGCLSVSTASSASQTFKVFPNPSAGSAWLEMTGVAIEADTELVLFDTQGRQVSSQIIKSARHPIIREGIVAGLYHFRVSLRGKTMHSGSVVFQ